MLALLPTSQLGWWRELGAGVDAELVSVVVLVV